MVKKRVRLTAALMLAMSVLPAALWGETGRPVAVRFWGQGMVSIETFWNLKVVIDPYALSIGFEAPLVEGHLVLVTHEHSDHSNVKLVRRNPHIERGLGADKAVRSIDVILDRPPNAAAASVAAYDPAKGHSDHFIRVRSVASFHDDNQGRDRGANAMFLIETDGVRILHCGDLGQSSLTAAQLGAIGQIDVLLIPVGGVYTVASREAVAITEQLKPRITVPIHYKLANLKFNLEPVEPFLERLPSRYERVIPAGNTLAVTAGRGQGRDKPRCVVLKAKPWKMPGTLSELFRRKAQSARSMQGMVAALSAGQMNHRPSNGTHTPRWNVEHTVGRDLQFFSSILTNVDPMIPVIDINPKQMPPDYRPAHPDWSGEEEARQIERCQAFIKRFGYLLAGMDIAERPKGSPRDLNGLFLLMENHYLEHGAHMRKKLLLPDWPSQ